jgi:class 3 adenylate cyclase/tetratricopeptide (TPR) repeat protein
VPVCARCGQENPDVARFCLACGAPLAAPAPALEERKLVTVLFCDIVGSTAKAERLDPEDVRARLAPYYERARAELESFGGTVEKFIGDAVVALFGAPVAHEDDPERAVRAALALRDAIAELNAEDEWLELDIRIGINTGEALVVLGARAAEGEGMASGDVMNTAARIQSAAPVNGIVVGELTYRATRGPIDYRYAEPVAAKGKSEPVPVWQVVGVREAEPSAAPLRLVGRGAQLENLRGVWRAAAAGQRAVALVVGAPGIGKSRLLRELTAELASEATVLSGRCLSYGEGITYWPVTEIVKQAAGILQSDDTTTAAEKLGALLERLPTSDADELRTIAAAVSNLLGVEKTPRGTYAAGQISQAELHWGVRRLFEHLARERPLALVVEDLHWAEATLLDLLRFVAQGEDERSLFILGSARPELLDVRHALVHGTITELVTIDALTDDESRDLLAQLAPLPQALIETVLRHADGNPLFLEEMVAMIVEEGLLESGRELQLESLPVPENVQALIGSRLDRLESAPKQTLQAASVVGHVFWRGAVQRLTESDGHVDDAIAELERRDFVRARVASSVAGETEFAFKHILIRDVAYAQLPKGRRVQLHVAFADWTRALPAGGDEFVEIVAYHLENACRLAGEIARSPLPPPVDDAVDALGRAADKVMRREGSSEAIRYYERALAVLGDRDPERALELRLALARAQAALGNVRESFEELAAVAAESAARPDLRCSALITLGNIDHRQGRPADGRERLVEAESLAETAGDPALRVRAAFGLAAVEGDYEAEADEAVARLRHAVSLAEEHGETALSIEGHLRLGFHLFNVGEIAAAEAELSRCTELAADFGSLRDQARAAFLLGLVRYYVAGVGEAEAVGLQARDWLERTGERYFQMQNFRALGLYALANDDLDAAERWLQAAIPAGLQEGGRYMIEVYRFLAETFVRQGRLGDAETIVEFAARSVPAEDAVADAYIRLGRAAVAAARGDREALSLYDDAIQALVEHKLPLESTDARIAYAAALRRFGEHEEAQRQLGLARSAYDRMGAVGASERATGEPARSA